MDRLTSTEGFTLVELCIVITGISVLACMSLPMREFSQDDYEVFGDGYLKTQSEAILSSQDKEYISPGGKAVRFNEDGNVQKAETVRFGKKNKKIIIELGGGRLVYR